MGIPAVVGTLAETTFGEAARDLLDKIKASDEYEAVKATSTGVLVLAELEWTITTILNVQPIPKRKDMS